MRLVMSWSPEEVAVWVDMVGGAPGILLTTGVGLTAKLKELGELER